MSDQIAKEIEEMISEITPGKAPDEKEAFGETEEASKEEAKPEEPPVEQPSEEPEKVESKETEPVEEQPVEEPAPTGPVEDPRITAMQETINRLSQQLMEAGGTVPTPPVEQSVAAPPAVKNLQQQAAQPAPVEMDLTKFKIIPEGVEFEDIVNDKATFENFMRDVLSRYEVTRVRRDSLATPVLVANQVRGILTLQEAVKNFYDVNKDLVSVRPLVGTFANRIVAEHPDWNLAQIMDESAKQTRAALGMMQAQQQQQQQPAPSKLQPTKPSFAVTSSNRPPAKTANVSKLQQQIDDLIS